MNHNYSEKYQLDGYIDRYMDKYIDDSNLSMNMT